VNEQNELERRYRRLLSWYPRDHREHHGDEMLGVLLPGAGERTRPSRRETTDLLRGAARIHLRRVVGADGGLRHRDVWAIVSLLGPVMMLPGGVRVLEQLADWFQIGLLVVTPEVPVWGIWAAVAVLSLTRMRRTAAIGAWLGTAGFVAAASVERFFWGVFLESAAWFLFGVVVAAALTWSPGPARGWELVGGRRVAVLVGAVGVSVLLVMKSAGTFSLLPLFILGMPRMSFGGPFLLWVLAVVLLVAAAMATARMRTREGRRAALLLCVPLVVSVCFLLSQSREGALVAFALCYGLPTVVVLGVPGLLRRPALNSGN
jgi:hypothetical protein